MVDHGFEAAPLVDTTRFSAATISRAVVSLTTWRTTVGRRGRPHFSSTNLSTTAGQQKPRLPTPPWP
jgi:hypothetical protein